MIPKSTRADAQRLHGPRGGKRPYIQNPIGEFQQVVGLSYTAKRIKCGAEVWLSRYCKSAVRHTYAARRGRQRSVAATAAHHVDQFEDLTGAPHAVGIVSFSC